MNQMLTSPRRRPHHWSRRRLAVAIAVSSLAVAACSSGEDAVTTSSPTTAAAATTTEPAATSTTSTSTPSEPDTAAEAVSTVPSTTSSPTVPSTTTTLPAGSAPTTTEALAVQELVLSGEGLGGAVFGADPDGVIEYVTSILGGNTDDTGWVAPDSFAICEGTEARRVDWGVLSLLFTDSSEFANGRRHFIGYEYGRVGEIGDEPAGLRTEGGVTLGSRVVDVLAEFPDAAVNPGEPDAGFPDNFYVSNKFYGLLTGTDADDYVTVLFGGYGCAE